MEEKLFLGLVLTVSILLMVGFLVTILEMRKINLRVTLMCNNVTVYNEVCGKELVLTGLIPNFTYSK